MKNGILIFLIALCILSCSKKHNTQQNNELKWINFDWVGDSIGNRYIDKLAINIPFTVEGIPHKFKSQFDLGATKTMIYKNSIKPYLNLYPEVSKKLDTINKKHRIQSQDNGAFKKINFKLDTVLFENQELVLFENFGDVLTKDSVHTSSIKHIGTIGADLFQGKYLVINFPNQKIAVSNSLKKAYLAKTSFVKVKLDNGRIKVPVTINGTTKYFMFDTGSSLFPLGVAKDDIKLISKSTIANDTLNVSSWGEYYDVHGYTMDSDISIGDYKINTNNLNVYDSKAEFKQFFESEKIMGLMGNTFFLDKIIIIDFKNKRFGIKDAE